MDARKRLKIRTIYGKLLTISVQEQTLEFISGFDKFGSFVKIPLREIESCEPAKEDTSNAY
jgi:hypothetical protein